MPRRPPIDPQGYYHAGSRGSYGRALFQSPGEHELFLELYERSARKYGWLTLAWTLVHNHHHFVIKLTDGGLSEGWREIHGSFSRRINAAYGLTRQGHLVRHAFFAKELESDAAVLTACRYVDLNEARATGSVPEASRWSSYRATVGLDRPRRFHTPEHLLAIVSNDPGRARLGYRRFVREGLVGSSQELRQTKVTNHAPARVVESAA